jgi:hypothetical protein
MRYEKEMYDLREKLSEVQYDMLKLFKKVNELQKQLEI